tara:strand:+ start:1543 stop:2058 length:516 start_codon:yes stop_codon:yes gene_type:complete
VIIKEILTDNSVYRGVVKMPKGVEINSLELIGSILESEKNYLPIKHCKSFDKLNNFIREFMQVEHKICIANKKTLGEFYKPKEITKPILQTDPVDIDACPDYVLLYGIQTTGCFVRIHYESLKSNKQYLDFELKKNNFLFFPANLQYQISNMQSKELNFIQTITYGRLAFY